ncbi:MAG: type II secretion system F family protein [Longimicrobiales bacterium]|nr:type II secretion system F family protein [Longimicrobiales bacterium]
MRTRSLIGAWRELDTARHKAEFYRMWHLGYRAGLPHSRVLSEMGAIERSPWVEGMRRRLLDGVDRRDTLADTLDRAPHLFTPFEAGLIKLGEEAGGLEEILRLLGDHFDGEHRRMMWVKKKMSYPMINLIAAIFIAPFPIAFFGNPLGYLVIVGTGTAAGLVSGGALVRLAVRRYRNRPRLVLARLLRSLAIAIEAGLPLDRALDTAATAADDASLSAHLARLPPSTRSGQPLADTLRGWRGLPAEAGAALRTAGETGDYTGTLRKLADLYEEGF